MGYTATRRISLCRHEAGLSVLRAPLSAVKVARLAVTPRHRRDMANHTGRVEPINKQPSRALANRPHDMFAPFRPGGRRIHLEPRLTANLCATPPEAGEVFDRVSPLASALRLCSSAPLRGAG